MLKKKKEAWKKHKHVETKKYVTKKPESMKKSKWKQKISQNK